MSAAYEFSANELAQPLGLAVRRAIAQHDRRVAAFRVWKANPWDSAYAREANHEAAKSERLNALAWAIHASGGHLALVPDSGGTDV